MHSSWMVVLMAIPMFTAYGVVYEGGPFFPLDRARDVPAVSHHSDGDRQRDHAAAREHVSGAAHARHPERDRGARRGRHRRAVPPRASGAAGAAGGISVARRLHHGSQRPDVAAAAERVGAARGDVVAARPHRSASVLSCSGRRRPRRWCSARCCTAGSTRRASARRRRAPSSWAQRRTGRAFGAGGC